jgi:hypothetical protein
LGKELGLGVEKTNPTIEETKTVATASEIKEEVDDLSLEELMKQLDDKSSEY